jgi:hypothetical protein
MAAIIPIEEVERIRAQVARANELAAARFRDSFAAQSDIPPNERWRSHLEIQAAALLETARDVRGHGRVHYDIMGRTVIPYIVRGEPLFRHFDIAPTPAALFEYWMVISTILASSGWSMTRVIATSDEYNRSLALMQQPQIVRALIASFLPEAEWRDDGGAHLEVTLYTRADEERIERRLLTMGADQEWTYHSRELIAEGRAGVRV